MPPQKPNNASGPLFGTGIIIVLLLIGAFYFWGAEMNRRHVENQLPLIPASDVAPVTN